MWNLLEKRNGPNLQYIQDGVGTCGMSPLSSTFYHMFDQDWAGLIIAQKEGYMKRLREPIVGNSREDSSMKFHIKKICYGKKFVSAAKNVMLVFSLEF